MSVTAHLGKTHLLILVALVIASIVQIGMLILNQRGIDASYYYWFPLVLAILYGLQHRMLYSPQSQPIKMSHQ